MSAVLDPQPKGDRPVHLPPPAPAKPEAPVAPAHTGLPRARLAALYAAPLAVLAVAYGTAVALYFGRPAEAPAVAAAGDPDGVRLYAQHCATCHGERGDGNGTTLLDPRARYFGYEKFKLATTANGVPTDDDLLRVLKRGIPGSAMPAFGQLPEADLRAVIGHVRDLTRKGMYERLRKKATDSGDEFFADEASVLVDKNCAPGQPLAVPTEFAAATPESVARGRKVYLSDAAGCSKCHGPDGRGDGPQVKELKNEDFFKTPARPRDFTLGAFKGGVERERLYTRVLLGIPGTPMPATTTLAKKDVDDLINYVLSLSQPPTNGAVAAAGK